MTTTSKSDRLAAAKAAGRASARRKAEQAAQLERFRSALVERVGPPDPLQEVFLAAACAFAIPLLKASRLSLGVNKRVNVLGLSAAFTSLRAALRLLGAIDATEQDGPPGPDASLEERQAWSRRYVERALAEGKEGNS